MSSEALTMASGKWQNKTMTDLYEDREEEAWYLGALGMLTASLMLLGFLVFAQAFSPVSSSASALTIIAAILLALGYSLSVALWFICRSWLFQLDAIFTPCLCACLIGTINSGITIGVNAQPWTATATAAIILGIVSAVLYAGLSFATFRKIQRVRNPTHSTIPIRESSENLKLLPEEEMQRQNLIQLLRQNEDNRSVQQTYQIGIPDNSVALRTPPPLTSPLPGLGLSGTLIGGPLSPYGNRNLSIDTRQPVIQSGFPYGTGSESSVSAQIATLEAARQKARVTQMKAAPPSPRDEEDSLPYPPVIVNTRNPFADDISNIPLSERHPLERLGHIKGRASKDSSIEQMYDSPPVHRTDDDFGGHDYEDDNAYVDRGPTFEIVEGEDICVDLTKDYARQQQPMVSRSAHPTYSSSQQVTIPSLAVTPPRRDDYLRNRSSR